MCSAPNTKRKATWPASKPSLTTLGFVSLRLPPAFLPIHLASLSSDFPTHVRPSRIPHRRATSTKATKAARTRKIDNDNNHSSQGLVKSTSRADQQLGVRLLSDIFRLSPERRRECLYYLALGNYKLGNYADARRYNNLLLDREPSNLQAADLRQLIDDKVAKEGLMGVAILGGVGIAAGVAGAFLLRNMRRK